MAKIDTMTDEDIEKMEAHIKGLKELVDFYKDIEVRNAGLIRENFKLIQIIHKYSKALVEISLSLTKMGIQMEVGVRNEKGKDG